MRDEESERENKFSLKRELSKWELQREKVSEDPSPVVFSTKSSWSYDMMSCCTASFCWSHHKQTNITKTDCRGKHVTSDLATYSSMSSNLYAECYILHVKSLVLLSSRQVKVYTGKVSSKNFLGYFCAGRGLRRRWTERFVRLSHQLKHMGKD